MTIFHWLRAGLAAGLLATLGLYSASDALSQKQDTKTKDTKKKADKPKPSTATAEELLKPGPRPKKGPLSPSVFPLEFVKNERVAFVGNSTGQRMALFGNFETALQMKYADKELVIRNFCRPADEVALRQRPSDYTHLDDPLYAFNPDTFICFFGYNESFAGPEGVDKFKADYAKFMDDYTKKYPRDDAGSPPRFVIVSPVAFEKTGDKYLPDGAATNANLKLYAAAAKQVAADAKVLFVDLFGPTSELFAKSVGLNFTTNGAHMNEAGDRELATSLFKGLFGDAPTIGGSVYEKIRAAVNDKAWVNEQDYRMLDGWYVYGGRRTFDTETFPHEYIKIRNMVAVRDRYIWDIAQGKTVSDKPDDSKTGELITPPTKFKGNNQHSEGTSLDILSPADLIKTCTIPEGFELKLFADEKMFPEIAKPVQMAFDSKGRLWCSTMPSYPLWKPGDPRPADKLVILEDTKGTGVADKCTVFYDKLHCPTGFEFYNGGVLVVDQPRILFLKDTTGNGKADLVVDLINGWASDDTHHTINAWEWSHGGYLQMLEGVSMSTAVETPWGAFHNSGSSGAYSLDPRSLKLTHFNTPGYGNPWCYVYNEWGQGFCGDGTGAKQHWDTLLSGAQYSGRPTVDPVFDNMGMRPVVGSEFLHSSNFPPEIRNHFIYACVINMNGLTRFTIDEDGSGYSGARFMKDGKPFDLLTSTHKHFRPVDPQIGPDGALWFGDWANALIGHMQYSQRDPNRNHDLGRIYRLYNTKLPLVKPVLQDGKTELELMEQLKVYEDRTRYRVRRELWARPLDKVKTAVATWVKSLKADEPNHDRLLCEALWVLQGHRAIDPALLEMVLACKTPNARAAAVKIAADERDRLPMAVEILKKHATDESSRVRIEAIRGLSFVKSPDAVEAVIAATKLPMDKWLTYVVTTTFGATQKVWATAALVKQLALPDNKVAFKITEAVRKSDKVGADVMPHLLPLIGTEKISPYEKEQHMKALASMKGGNAERGRLVIKNSTCLACHKLDKDGQDYGPNFAGVGTRWNKFKLVESIIDPNAEIDPKYLTTQILTKEGKSISGLFVSEDAKQIVIFDGKDKQTIAKDNVEEKKLLKQSSMPEGLAGTMAPSEFLDVVEFLSTLKDPNQKPNVPTTKPVDPKDSKK